MELDRIRENLARLFLGRVSVRFSPACIGSPEVKTIKRAVELRTLRPPARVVGTVMAGAAMDSLVSGGALPFRETVLGVKARNFPVRVAPSVARGWKCGIFGRAAVKSVKFSQIVTRKNLKKALHLPQERESRLFFARGKLPPGKQEIPLAFFWPLIQDGVVKSVLNKEKGTLFVWYNPHSRAFFPGGLLLLRRLGPGGGTEWRWTGLKRPR